MPTSAAASVLTCISIGDPTDDLRRGRQYPQQALPTVCDLIGERSLIYTRLLRPYFFKRSTTDLARYVGIVKKASDLVRDKYGSTLVVVLWDTFGDRSELSDSDSDQIEQLYG